MPAGTTAPDEAVSNWPPAIVRPLAHRVDLARWARRSRQMGMGSVNIFSEGAAARSVARSVIAPGPARKVR